jgi:hypothetical protein
MLLLATLLNLLAVIFVLRTWAIWERSRPVLVFLIGLIIVQYWFFAWVMPY